MESILSYCGLICSGCPISWATNEKDKKLKEKMKVEIARMSNEMYKTSFTSKDIIDCDGCKESGRLFTGCVNCNIRNCANAKNLMNCAHCDDYICSDLEQFFKENNDAKIRLEFVRSII